MTMFTPDMWKVAQLNKYIYTQYAIKLNLPTILSSLKY